MTICVGVDPGANGAIAFIDIDSGELLMVEDMPVDKTQTGKHVRSRVARGRLLEIMYRAKGATVFTERPEGRPMKSTNKKTGQIETRQPGAAGMLSLGENYGNILMSCTAAEMAVTEIRPGQWKSKLSVSASKDDAIRRASELFPSHTHLLARKKDDGRAEAILLAYYGMLSLRGRFHADTDKG